MLKQFRNTLMFAIVAGLLAALPVGIIAGADGQDATGYVYESTKTDQLTGSYRLASHDATDGAAQIAGRGASGMFQWHKQTVPAWNTGNDDENGYASCGSSCGKRAVLGTKSGSDVIPVCSDASRWTVTNDCDTHDEASVAWGLYAASESPFSSGDYATAASRSAELVTLPVSIVVISVVYNINGCANGQLKLTGALISRMYRGTQPDGITMWNHADLVALNPCLAGEATAIKPVIRSDGSGTTFAFSDYLKRSSGVACWGPADLIGTCAENEITGAGNPGVSAAVGANYGAFGYVEKQQADVDGRKQAQVQARDGAFLLATEQGGTDAATATAPTLPKSHESWAAVSIAYASGATSYPISTFGYLLAISNPYDAVGTNGASGPVVNYRDLWTATQYNTLKEFFSWANTCAQDETCFDVTNYAPVGAAIAAINAEGIDRMNYGPRVSYDLGNDNTDLVALCGYPAVGQNIQANSDGSFSISSIAGGKFAASSAGALVGATEAEGGYFAVTGAIQAVGPIVTIDGIPAGRVACGATIDNLAPGTTAYGQVVDGSFLVHFIG